MKHIRSLLRREVERISKSPFFFFDLKDKELPLKRVLYLRKSRAIYRREYANKHISSVRINKKAYHYYVAKRWFYAPMHLDRGWK